MSDSLLFSNAPQALHHQTPVPAAAAVAGAPRAAERPDAMAWATWLRWGQQGDPRSLQLLRHDLVRRGVWGLAAAGTGPLREGQAWPARFAAWSPYERALGAAAVALICRAMGGSPAHRAWAPAGLAQALRSAHDGPHETTPDGAPMQLACGLVFAATALAPAAPAEGHAEGLGSLAAVLADARFNGLPLAWRQAAWRVAEVHHRQHGDPVLARGFLALLAAADQSASALLARLQLASKAGAPLMGL